MNELKKCLNCGKIHTPKTDICDQCGTMKFTTVIPAAAVPASAKNPAADNADGSGDKGGKKKKKG